MLNKIFIAFQLMFMISVLLCFKLSDNEEEIKEVYYYAQCFRQKIIVL